MRFFRHDGIYRSDVLSLLFTPGACPAFRSGRCQGIGHAGKNTPCPSSAMSSGRLILDRVGRHQSPSPLHRHHQNKPMAFRRVNDYHRTRNSVLTVCVSRGDKRKLSFQIELTRKYGLAVCGNEDIRSASNQRCLSELIRQVIYTGE
jgi:hypothetical protein